jgi:L-threonylcarbamoyladenylate synthase
VTSPSIPTWRGGTACSWLGADVEIVEVGADPAAAVAAAVEVLRAGRVVVIPTDTVYGIAASPMTGGTEELFALKGRPPGQPLAVLADSHTQVSDIADLTETGRHLAGAHWPGPLTLVLPRRPGLGFELGDGEEAATIGVRVPDHALPRALALEVGPIATTSANRHGEDTPSTAAEAAGALTGPPTLVLDGGPCAGGASTVVDCTGPEARILREGPLTAAALGLT